LGSLLTRLMTTEAAVSPLPITHAFWATRVLSACSCSQ